jgi:hypothetical protein
VTCTRGNDIIVTCKKCQARYGTANSASDANARPSLTPG